MVYFKLTDGETIRKFKVNAGDITYDQLRERIATLFPTALDNPQDLLLQYRDSDGDVITVSTDQEFQEVLSELPEGYVWKLHIAGNRAKPTPAQTTSAPRRRRSDLFSAPSDFFFHPTHRPFGGLMSDPWFGMGSRCPFFNNSWSSINREFDRVLDTHSRELKALHSLTKDAGGSDSAANQGEVAESSDDGAVSGVPGMKVKSFGSWDPKEFEGPFGTGTIVGPVGYYVSWNSGSGEKEEGKGEQKEGGAGTGAQEMETSTQ